MHVIGDEVNRHDCAQHARAPGGFAQDTESPTMQLTQFTDYALRTLLYLGVHGDRLVPIAEVSAAYGISNHHLVKVASLLVRAGYVQAVRGRGGGMQLAQPPGALRLGAVVRTCEPHMNLVECFDRQHNTCPIVAVCELAGVLGAAQAEFLARLDGYSLADLLHPGPKQDRLTQIWRRKIAAAKP
jgi:Rrf2 family nitric oxide-sensitive transcriptional repressor